MAEVATSGIAPNVRIPATMMVPAMRLIDIQPPVGTSGVRYVTPADYVGAVLGASDLRWGRVICEYFILRALKFRRFVVPSAYQRPEATRVAIERCIFTLTPL
ncbi:hypothetical protein GCM10009860_14320 [Microbacterium mitrae]